MRNIFKYHLFLEILFIFFLSLTPLLWFSHGIIIVGHDNVFGLDPITFLKGRLYTWVDHGFGQGQDLIMGTIPIHLIDAIPYYLGFSLQNTEKIVYVFWFFLIGLSAYILAMTLKPESLLFKLTTVILYQFNFFLLQAWWIGERTKFSAFIAFPLILAVFIKVYRKELGLLHGVILNSIIFFIFNAGGLYGIPLYGGMFIAIATFVLFFTLIDFFKKRFFSIKRLILLTILTFIGYLFVNSYFIFPVLSRLNDEYRAGVNRVGGTEGLHDWVNVISANTSYTNLFRMQGIAEWYDNQEHPYAKYYFQNPILITLSFLFPLLIFLSLFTVRHKNTRIFVLFFFLVYLIGIFFAAGSHRPFGFAYNFLLQTIPGFASFRSPFYKFAPAIFLAASFLIAFFIDQIKGKTKQVVFFAIIIFVFVYHFPYFTGDFFSWREGFSTRIRVPEHVYQFASWLNNEKRDDTRTLFLPPNSPNFRYSAYDWGYLSFQSLPTLFSNKSVVINNDRLNDSERKLVETLYRSFTNRDVLDIRRLSAYLGIRYFLLQEDTVSEDVRSSFSLNVKPYQEVIENELQLPLIKKFGRWSLYKIDSNVFPAMPFLYTKDRTNIVSGQARNFSTYYDFTTSLSVFVKKEDLQSITSDINSIPDIYSPNCLKCKKKDRPFIKYPDRNILPDSPLYPLVLYSEEQNLHVGDPKSLVYDYLGLTLKRFAEIREMIEKDIEIKDTAFNGYEATIRLTHASFNKLAKREDKFDIAEDLRYYIDDMRTVITIMLGDRVRIGLPVVIFTRMLASLGTLELALKPYSFKPDIMQNRLYNLAVDRSGMFGIYIRSRKFKGLLKDKAKIRVRIDSGKQKDLVIDANFPQSKWLTLGDIELQKGDHTILLSFGEIVNLIDSPSLAITQFNSDGKAQCYTTRIRDFDFRKQYKMLIRYRNNLLNDINVYVWEERKKGIRISSADRMRPSLLEEEFTQDIEHKGENVKGVIIGMCAVGLTQEYLRDHFDIKVHEFVEPEVLFVSKDLQDSSTKEVTYQKVNPTKYIASFVTSVPNTILVFPSRFDKGWKLESFEERHIAVNGYANGWIIEKPGTYSLTLEYKPQRVFLLGGLVSLVSVSAGILCIIIIAFKRRGEKNNDE